MAVMSSRDNRTEIAGAGGTTQFKFVTLDAGGAVTTAGSAGEQAYGICLVGAAVGNATTICVSGKVMVTAGGTIAAGDAVQTDAAGDATTAAAGDVVMGYAKEAGVDGQIIAIELIQGGNIVPA
tara:strand:+ start:37 stop:408 length:372 start_codon:yes stop_codon:yes gene_type:complete